MSISSRRIVLLMLGLSSALVGFWAGAAPDSWYRSFPGFGRHWVSVLGPYNEHLIRDVASLYLALLALTAGAWLRPADSYLIRLTALAWLVFGVPHLSFHLFHLAMYGTTDQVLNLLSLGAAVVLPALLLLPVPDGVRSGSDAAPLDRAGRAAERVN